MKIQRATMARWCTGLSLAIGLCVASNANAQRIAAWDFTGASSVATWTAEVFNANLDSSAVINRGAGAGASTGGNSFRTQGFKNEGIATANTDYFQVALSAADGYGLSLTTVTGKFEGTASFYASPGGTGP